jgi:hypothetical protein
MQDRPLLDRLSPKSHRALIAWALGYALNHRDEITPAVVAQLRKGNKSQQRAAELLSSYGLEMTRQTAGEIKLPRTASLIDPK